ncbi:uncharacterized protein LOC141707499 [Apium graveolens]|uniref:uncharacterized protein LOC141707499 n=1 Tax=Apium graveolens TaxID=4045 RepID=UPI003D7BCF6A
MKRAADAHRHEESFLLGDWVYLKLQPYRQQSLARRPFDKLAARFYGPFKISQKIGAVAYQLELPESSKIHPVFHVSQLKRAVGHAPANPTIPSQLTSELELIVEPEELLEVRQIQQGSVRKLEALIKWKGLPNYEATWEDVEKAGVQFPDFHLEDKVSLWGQGSVIHPTEAKQPIMYSRRKNKDARAKRVKLTTLVKVKEKMESRG